MKIKNAALVPLIFLLAIIQSQGQITVVLKDTSFLGCLKGHYPSTINTSGQLIVAEAAKLQGSLVCQNRNIKSAEGIQYFTSVNTINLQTNYITYLPDISNLTKLKTFNVAENALNYLPEFSKLPGLQEIYAHRNKIKVVPDLSNNDSLKTLYIHSNLLDTIPDFSQLTQLVRLNLTYNNLRYIPNLDKMVSLQIFECWKNGLVELPPLDALKNLNTLNASYNNLTKVPSLGSNSSLQIVFLNDNDISKLSDFSKCPNLQNVRLYNNPLTFGELLSLVTIPGYDTLFKLNPQQPHLVGYSQRVKEADTLMISTGIDRGVPNVEYRWYKNGVFFKSTPFDTLLIPKTLFSDSGIYKCYLKHPSFLGDSLFTDNFSVGIDPCLNFKNVYVTTSDINCLSAGTISVTGDDISNVSSFELTSPTGNKYVNSSGKFSGLSELSYGLVLKTGTGCTKNYPNKIQLNQKDCEEVLISPDNDGVSDSYYFSEVGKVTIYDKRGQTVRTLSIPGEWDGSSEKGKVFSGFYVADINNGKKILGITVLY
jgi:hypothetical protein